MLKKLTVLTLLLSIASSNIVPKVNASLSEHYSDDNDSFIDNRRPKPPKKPPKKIPHGFIYPTDSPPKTTTKKVEFANVAANDDMHCETCDEFPHVLY